MPVSPDRVYPSRRSFGIALRLLAIPVLQGLMIGHIDDQATVPVGAMARLDADQQQLTVIGPYLR